MKKDSLKGLNVGLKRHHEGYRSSLRLQQQVAHLTQLVEKEQQALEDTHARHMLLANATLLHRVTHQFMHPLYQQWAQEDAIACTRHSHDTRLLSKLPLVQSNPNWQLLLQIATSSSKVMRWLLSVTPDQVRQLASFSVEDTRQLTTECVHGMIMLSEMLMPARYPSGLLMPEGQQPAAAVGGLADLHSPTETAEELTEAAQELLTRLEQYQALLHKMSVSVSVLMALQPTVLIGLAAVDLETGKHSSPPAGHFLQAAKRLSLTAAQLTELLRIRELSNRMASQIRSKGTQLVGQMADSVSHLTSLSAPTSRASGSSGQMSTAQQQQSDAESRQHEKGGLGVTQQQQEKGDVAEVVLEQLLQQHVHALGDIFMVQGTWVTNVITPWQHGLYAAACWPFQASLGALVELAPLLTPDDSPPLQINDTVCPEAAAAAALGAELGYVRAHQFMQQRHDAMDVHLTWVLQELGLLQE